MSNSNETITIKINDFKIKINKDLFDDFKSDLQKLCQNHCINADFYFKIKIGYKDFN